MSYRVIDGSPCDARISAYIALLLKDVGGHANSIYRGSDPAAARILHKHGKHTQAELYATLPKGVANPPGFSSHELRSDGNPFYGVPRGGKLQWWMQGFDVDDHKVKAMIKAATARKWVLRQPYPGGVEFHHLNFAKQPRPMGPKTLAKLVHIRAILPRS